MPEPVPRSFMTQGTDSIRNEIRSWLAGYSVGTSTVEGRYGAEDEGSCSHITCPRATSTRNPEGEVTMEREGGCNVSKEIKEQGEERA